MWSANVHHNSRGAACVRAPHPALVDLGIASVIAIAAANKEAISTEEIVGSLATVGVFAASGIIGSIYAHKCRNHGRNRTSVAPRSKPIPKNPVPLEGPLLPLGPESERLPPRPHNPLWPPDDYFKSESSLKKEPIPCNAEVNSDCPHMHLCVPVTGNMGFCQPIGDAPSGQ